MKKYLPLTITLFLTACGGGSEKAPSTEVNASAQVSTDSTSSKTESKFRAIAGVYDASYQDDKAFVLITEEGKYLVYDSLNDDKGGNKFCFTNPSDTTPNKQYHGLSFTFDENSRHYNLQKAQPSLAFEVDESDKLQYIIYGDSITVGGNGLTIGSSTERVVISLNRITEHTAEAILKNTQCS